MHIHILGICGTFMGGIAALAKTLGHRVTGSDQHVYPPMSTQLDALGIELIEGYDPVQLEPAPDLVIIGNSMSRGNSCVEEVLNQRIPYTSGAQWLHDEVLQSRWVLAVAGTHGKTTTSSMLAWLLEDAGLQPGFLVGGVLANFGCSARLGDSDFFVIEADEYDTAFFDKRSKFVHYQPSTLILNNLEFDHADIFSDLAAIQKQFEHLLRVVPSHGQILFPQQEDAVQEVLQRGCWSETMAVAPVVTAEAELAQPPQAWQAVLNQPDGREFSVYYYGEKVGQVEWSLLGEHNVANALMAIAAAQHVGIAAKYSCEALTRFQNTKRRLEIRGEANHITVYDDFAHHPTAIATTLQGLKAHVGDQRVIAVFEPRSNTMKRGVHQHALAEAFSLADEILIVAPADLMWSVSEAIPRAAYVTDVVAALEHLAELLQPDDHVVIMSNGGFDNIHERLLTRLNSIKDNA